MSDYLDALSNLLSYDAGGGILHFFIEKRTPVQIQNGIAGGTRIVEWSARIPEGMSEESHIANLQETVQFICNEIYDTHGPNYCLFKCGPAAFALLSAVERWIPANAVLQLHEDFVFCCVEVEAVSSPPSGASYYEYLQSVGEAE